MIQFLNLKDVFVGLMTDDATYSRDLNLMNLPRVSQKDLIFRLFIFSQTGEAKLCIGKLTCEFITN